MFIYLLLILMITNGVILPINLSRNATTFRCNIYTLQMDKCSLGHLGIGPNSFLINRLLCKWIDPWARAKIAKA